MRARKNSILESLIFLIGLGVYNLCVFLLVNNFTDIVWVSYGFTTAAFLIPVMITILLNREQNMQSDGFSKIPFYVFSGIYLVIQLVTGILILLFPLSFTVSLIIQVAILAVFLGIFLFALMGRDHISENEKTVHGRTGFIQELIAETEYFYRIESQYEKKAELRKIYEAVRYSDPVSSTAEICEVNRQIKAGLQFLYGNMDDISVEELRKNTKYILDLLTRRNNLCKRSKSKA